LWCQILLASDRGKNAYQIAHELGCNPQTARNAIHAFNQKGLPEALQPGSKHLHTVHRAFDPEQAEALRELLHQKPRTFGKDTSLWTLDLAAEVSFEEGLTKERGEPMRLFEQSVAKDDPDPKAISCYGLYLPEFEKVWLRFVDDRPVSGITTCFLAWCCEKLEAAGKRA
jgi:transposase